MKHLLTALLTLAVLLAALTVSVSAAGTEFNYDMDSSVPTTGGFYAVATDSGDPTYGKVVYLASRAGQGDSQITVQTDYAEKLVEFDFLYSGDFGTYGGLYTAIYQNGDASVYTILSPIYNCQIKDNANHVLADHAPVATETDTWYKAKFIFESNTLYAKVWAADAAEPAEWTVSAAASMTAADAGSSVVIQLAGGGAGTANLFFDNLHIAPMTDAIRAQVHPAAPETSAPVTDAPATNAPDTPVVDPVTFDAVSSIAVAAVAAMGIVLVSSKKRH